MYCIVNDNKDLEVHVTKTDLCFKCKYLSKCPFLNAIQDEYVVMHYSDIDVKDCGVFKRL